MLAWLVPLCVFPVLAAAYLGGGSVRFEGGSGPREVLGLVLTLIVFLAVWAAARALLVMALSSSTALILATIAAGLLLPAAGRAAFRITGVRLRSGRAAAH